MQAYLSTIMESQMLNHKKTVITLMGQAETKSDNLQKNIDTQLSKPSTFVEDMTPEERAKYYKSVLNVL